MFSLCSHQWLWLSTIPRTDLPRLPGFAAGGFRSLHGLWQPSPGPAPRALWLAACSCRLRRLLCRGRKARQSGFEGQASDHRRRQARCRVHGMLHRPHTRRAFGHADVQGAGGLSRCDRAEARYGKVCPRRARDSRDDAGAHPPCRTDLHRRSVPRPCRHRTAAWSACRQGAGAFRPRCRKGDRGHHLGRTFLL